MKKTEQKLLWLDDLRDPNTMNWLRDYAQDFENDLENVVWVKTYEDFIDWIKFNGLPYKVAFDHDLGEDLAKDKVSNGMSKRQARREKRGTMNGYDAAKWLVEYCMDKKLKLPHYVVQSANPVGAENIRKHLNNFINFQSR